MIHKIFTTANVVKGCKKYKEIFALKIKSEV